MGVWNLYGLTEREWRRLALKGLLDELFRNECVDCHGVNTETMRIVLCGEQFINLCSACLTLQKKYEQEERNAIQENE